MPDRDSTAGHPTRLRGLLWAGLLLAPVAAAIVVLGHDYTAMRTAVLLIAVSVVLVGTSVLVRNDPVLLRMDVEDQVAREVAALRAELRSGAAASLPRQRGAAPVPPGPSPRASAAVRPDTAYGRTGSPGGNLGYAAGDDGGGYRYRPGYDDRRTGSAHHGRRHRPSPNDADVGTPADFAGYPPLPGARYVRDHGGPRERR